MELIKFYKIL